MRFLRLKITNKRSVCAIPDEDKYVVVQVML